MPIKNNDFKRDIDHMYVRFYVHSKRGALMKSDSNMQFNEYKLSKNLL